MHLKVEFTEESPRSRTLLANCFAVVVLPHHLGPSINTAPLPSTLRLSILSEIRCLYFAITDKFDAKIPLVLQIAKQIGINSVICGDFIRYVVR